MPETAKKANSASKKRSGGEEVIGFIFTGRIVDQFGELTRRRGQPGIESFSSLICRPTKPHVSASLEIGHGLTRMNTDKNPCKLVPHQHLSCVLSTWPIGDPRRRYQSQAGELAGRNLADDGMANHHLFMEKIS
ncbi:MAG: hypothetical protein KA362_06425 [Chloroflexi bacterium]|nr:hypothetical protein [Chloroflexota bacterium]